MDKSFESQTSKLTQEKADNLNIPTSNLINKFVVKIVFPQNSHTDDFAGEFSQIPLLHSFFQEIEEENNFPTHSETSKVTDIVKGKTTYQHLSGK